MIHEKLNEHIFPKSCMNNPSTYTLPFSLIFTSPLLQCTFKIPGKSLTLSALVKGEHCTEWEK